MSDKHDRCYELTINRLLELFSETFTLRHVASQMHDYNKIDFTVVRANANKLTRNHLAFIKMIFVH